MLDPYSVDTAMTASVLEEHGMLASTSLVCSSFFQEEQRTLGILPTRLHGTSMLCLSRTADSHTHLRDIGLRHVHMCLQ